MRSLAATCSLSSAELDGLAGPDPSGQVRELVRGQVTRSSLSSSRRAIPSAFIATSVRNFSALVVGGRQHLARRGTRRPPRPAPRRVRAVSACSIRSSSSYSISAAIRPSTAYSTLRSCPFRWRRDCVRQPIAHLTLPKTSHTSQLFERDLAPGQLVVALEVRLDLPDAAEPALVGAEAPRADDRPGDVARPDRRRARTPSRAPRRGRPRRPRSCRRGSRRGRTSSRPAARAARGPRRARTRSRGAARRRSRARRRSAGSRSPRGRKSSGSIEWIFASCSASCRGKRGRRVAHDAPPDRLAVARAPSRTPRARRRRRGTGRGAARRRPRRPRPRAPGTPARASACRGGSRRRSRGARAAPSRRRGRPPTPPSTRRPRAGAPTRSGRASPRAPLSLRQFGNGTQRGGIARRDEQRRRARLAERVQPLGDALLRADERDLVDEVVRHRGDRLALLPVEVEILDLRAPRPRTRSARRARCRSSCRARPSRRCRARSTPSARRAPPARRRAAPPGRSARCRSRRARRSSGRSRARAPAEKKSGIQPSAISNASSTDFGPIDAR